MIRFSGPSYASEGTSPVAGCFGFATGTIMALCFTALFLCLGCCVAPSLYLAMFPRQSVSKTVYHHPFQFGVRPAKGEKAIIHTNEIDGPTFLPVSESDLKAASLALSEHDRSALQKMLSAGQIVEVEEGAEVAFLEKSMVMDDAARVEIKEGKHSGKIVFVPFSWLHRIDGQ